ncbi:hypothetical protein D9615_007613 [Tricholomella constricta]|uniref:GmrSD restriction endonucleases C-terminal domain-containing protein n=1 Tax=Tricholomella constricta TaxID=117010 RepID=A0A8H5M1T4_9AGAR|nr:hypothetical protein D9615_007613 [Tricholomella constricta]
MIVLVILFSVVAFALASPIAPEARASHELPTPVSAATAMTYLASLTVGVDDNVPAYNRSRFKHWHIVSGTCDTRKTVLKRDGTDVVVDAACKPTSGNWVSPYDDVTTTVASQFDIDHIVPLKEAWVSGARLWTDAKREAFANDLTLPQLVAVSARSNRSKGDKDPALWVPPSASYLCTYIRAWVEIKYKYHLAVDATEKTVLTDYLAACSVEEVDS